MKKILLTIAWMLLSTITAKAQMIAANVDALWLATLSPNLGFELVIGERSTISLNGMIMSKPLGKDVKLYALQPEYRYYFSGRPMYREFIGFGAIGGTYDITWSGKVYDGTRNISWVTSMMLTTRSIMPKGLMQKAFTLYRLALVSA